MLSSNKVFVMNELVFLSQFAGDEHESLTAITSFQGGKTAPSLTSFQEKQPKNYFEKIKVIEVSSLN